MIRILIVDDHAIVREGLKQIVSEIPDIAMPDEASDGGEALEKVRMEDYDLVILDIALPDRNGLDVLKEMKTLKPNLSVLILSMHPEERIAVRVLKAGASGYLTKTSAPDELVAAIRKVATGGEYVTSSLAERLAFCLRTGSEGPLHETLSDREYLVMIKLASGKTVKEIAQEMCLSPKTISTHRTHILEKMGMKSNADLTEYAMSNHLMG